MATKKDTKQEKKLPIFKVEEILDKDPKIFAEHLFEHYDQESINSILKNLQKKIMESENSLKQMLSLKYVDLLNCSELIQNLKVFTKDITHNANATQGYLHKSDEVLQKLRSTLKTVNQSAVKAASQIPKTDKSNFTAADEHLFYTGGQKILITHCRDKNSLETLMIITTFLNIYRSYELSCSVKRSRKMSELLFLLEDALFTYFDKSFDFSTGTNNYDNMLPIFALMKLRKYINNYGKQADFERTEICQYLKNKLDCDVSKLLLQDTAHSDELLISLKTFLRIIEAVIKQSDGDPLITLQFFMHQLAETVRIFLMEKEPYMTVCSYLDTFKKVIANLFPFEKLGQVEKFLEEAVDLESDLYFEDTSTPMEEIQDFYRAALKFIQPLLISLITGSDRTQLSYKNIRSLLFEGPSLRDFKILEEYLWKDELKEFNMGELIKDLWRKHVDQTSQEMLAKIQISSRAEKLIKEIEPNALGSNVGILKKSIDVGVEDFTKTLEALLSKFIQIIETGAQDTVQEQFYNISQVREGFEMQFEETLKAISATLESLQPNADRPNSIESKIVVLFLLLAFLDLTFANIRRTIQEDAKFEPKRENISLILNAAEAGLLKNCYEKIDSYIRIFISELKTPTHHQITNWSQQIALTILDQSNLGLRRLSEFLRRVNLLTISLGLFSTNVDSKPLFTTAFQNRAKAVIAENYKEENNDQVSSLLKSFESSADSAQPRELEFLQFYEHIPSFATLSSVRKNTTPQRNNFAFNPLFPIQDTFLNVTLFSQGSQQPALNQAKGNASETNRKDLFVIGNESRAIAQQTEEVLEKARNMVGGMVSNLVSRFTAS